MFYYKQCLILVIVVVSQSYSYVTIEVPQSELELQDIKINLKSRDFYAIAHEDESTVMSDVNVKLYYESLCPDCIDFDKKQFSTAVMLLGQYVDFHTYPYGNAMTFIEDGQVKFQCQHGPKECYGNKLHACAIDYFLNFTEAVVFNSCMMGGIDHGSNDKAADRCAKFLSIDADPIKSCAKSDKGTKLLQYYGEESKKANFSYVPYILINGQVNDGENFVRAVCSAFVIPPPPCVDLSLD